MPHWQKEKKQHRDWALLKITSFTHFSVMHTLKDRRGDLTNENSWPISSSSDHHHPEQCTGLLRDVVTASCCKTVQTKKSLFPSSRRSELNSDPKPKPKHKPKHKWNIMSELDPRWVAERPTQLRAAGLNTCSQWHKYTRPCTPYIWKWRKAEENASKFQRCQCTV